MAASNPLLNTPSQETQVLTARLTTAEQRLTALDAQNRELTAQIAQAQQVVQNERQQKKLIQEQLALAANQLKTASVARDEVEKRANALFASQRQVGGAAITANSSIKQSLRIAEVAGFEVRQEGTAIRVDIPADRIFTPGTPQFTPQAPALLNDVAAAISKNYPKQLIVIEGHTDTNPALAAQAGASHQLAAGQAHMVLEYLVSQGHLPANQLSSMSFGSHRPRFSNATPQGPERNRRIELVIYPDTL